MVSQGNNLHLDRWVQVCFFFVFQVSLPYGPILHKRSPYSFYRIKGQWGGEKKETNDWHKPIFFKKKKKTVSYIILEIILIANLSL